jgi:hypothetical protein
MYVDCHVTKSKVQAGAVTVAEFSKALSKLTGIALQQFIAKHAEINGQTKIVNQFV